VWRSNKSDRPTKSSGLKEPSYDTEKYSAIALLTRCNLSKAYAYATAATTSFENLNPLRYLCCVVYVPSTYLPEVHTCAYIANIIQEHIAGQISLAMHMRAKTNHMLLAGCCLSTLMHQLIPRKKSRTEQEHKVCDSTTVTEQIDGYLISTICLFFYLSIILFSLFSSCCASGWPFSRLH
jgi:hypothetical protein